MPLAYLHVLHHTNLLDSFEDSAWTNIYCTGSTEDPLAMCLSNFISKCNENKIIFARNFNEIIQNDGPFIFILSEIIHEENLDNILNQVKNGSNLLIISCSSVDTKKFANLNNMSNLVECIEQITDMNVKEKTNIKFDNGQIFFIEDSYISDINVERGPFGCTDKWEINKINKVDGMSKLISDISTFNIACIDCKIRSLPETWPNNQPLILEMEIKNISNVEIENLVLDLSLIAEFEPLSHTCIEVEILKPKMARSIGTITIPRVKGTFKNPLKISVRINNNPNQNIYLPENQITILDNMQSILRSSKPRHIDLQKELPKYDEYLYPISSSSKLFSMMDLDPEVAVAKVRRIAEQISKTLATKNNLYCPKNRINFAKIIKDLYDNKILSDKAKGYLETIRVFGNIAVHSDDFEKNPITTEDTLLVYYSLVLLLEEIKSNELN